MANFGLLYFLGLATLFSLLYVVASTNKRKLLKKTFSKAKKLSTSFDRLSSLGVNPIRNLF